MYFVFRHAIRSFRNQTIQAKIQKTIPEIQPHWWDCKPLSTPLSSITFAINRNWPLPDNFFTGNLLDLYSSRMIALLNEAGVKFETFSTEIIDSKTEAVLPVSYEIFHLLESFSGVDWEKSTINSGQSNPSATIVG